MRKILLFISLTLLCANLMAQIKPVLNTQEELTSSKVKMLSVFYVPQNGGDERLVFQKAYDPDGKILKKYQLSLWEAVSNSHTTTYNYNSSGLLIEEIIIQEFLNLFERDRDYLEIFGNKPLHKKIIYHYDDRGQLIKKEIYSFGDLELSEDATPVQTIYYQYENGYLVSEESSSVDEKFFNQNYNTEFSYDSAGNMIRKIIRYGKEEKMKRKYIYSYDSVGHLIQDQVLDSAIPHNNRRIKYDYNENGQVTHKYLYNDIEQLFELETSYSYNERGNAIQGDREVNFEYYPNGLIKSESWTDPVSSEQIILTTKYTYFQ